MQSQKNFVLSTRFSVIEQKSSVLKQNPLFPYTIEIFDETTDYTSVHSQKNPVLPTNMTCSLLEQNLFLLKQQGF